MQPASPHHQRGGHSVLEIGKEEILGLLAVMASVVGVLWGVLVRKSKAEEERLAKAEKERMEAARALQLKTEESHQTILKISNDYSELKGRLDGITELSNKVLEKIEETQK